MSLSVMMQLLPITEQLRERERQGGKESMSLSVMMQLLPITEQLREREREAGREGVNVSVSDDAATADHRTA